MRFKDFLGQIPFFVILFFQTYLIATFSTSSDPLLTTQTNPYAYINFLVKIDLFTLAVLIALAYFFPMLAKVSKEEGHRKRILNIIFIYFVYQVLIIAPLSYLDGMGTVREIAQALVPRFALLLIPFFFWYVLPIFRKPEKLYPWFNISSIFIAIGAYFNYENGIIYTTNTGQMRLLSSGAVVVFALVFIINFFKKERKIENYFFIILSLVGLIAANFRAAYVFLFLIIVIGLWLMNKTGSKLRTLVMSVLVIAAVFLSLAQNGVIWENFSQRFQSISLQDENAQVRFEYWRLAYDRFTDSPLNGSMAQNAYYRPMYASDYPPPHNFVFEILSTQGIVGLLFFTYLLIATIIVAVRNRKDETSLQMLLVLIFYILFATFNPTFLNSWTMLVLIVAISIILSRDKALRIAADSTG